jgi:hypothetical protein
MKLRGILDRAIGNAICIRGYADIKDIARCSRANDNYQRQIIPEHKDDIATYLDKAKYKFFPEVILSYTLDQVNDNVDLRPSQTEIISTSSSKGKPIKFSVTKNEWAGKDSRTTDKVYTATIDIDDELIKIEQPFHRIDGNHRLSAVDAMDDYYGKLKILFCIILLRNDKEDEKFESVFFEYGYAKSLNKPIILAKKESDKKHKVPFDVEHNLRFKYAGDNDLKDLMIQRIKQILVQLKYVVNK